jgi:hypothetical protein
MSDARRPSLWPAVVVTVSLALILAFVVIYTIRQIRTLPVDLVKAFQQGTITTRFISYATQVRGVRNLEIAKSREVQIFTEKDERYIAWGLIPLRDVEVEFRCPVETVYYVDLKGTWHMTLQDRKITVLAPPIEFNTPSILFSEVEYHTLKGEWLAPFRSKAVAENLKQKISALVKLRAREIIPNVTGTARREVEGFMRAWLAHDFPQKGQYEIEVRFEGELESTQPRTSDRLR